MVKKTFAGLTPTEPSQAMFADLYQSFAEPEAWHIFADVTPILVYLKTRPLRLAIISNWDERLRPLLHRLRLDSEFDPIVVSAETGYGKPSQKIYHQACRLLGMPPENILHIGDSEEEDVLGATAAGLQALLLERSGKREGAGRIGSLQGLPQMLGV